jgi:hypothetical protein
MIRQGRSSVHAAAQHRERCWPEGARACLEGAARWRASAIRTKQEHANCPLPAGLSVDFRDRQFLILAVYPRLRTTSAMFEDIVRVDAAESAGAGDPGQIDPGDYALIYTARGRDLVAFAAAPRVWLSAAHLTELAHGRAVAGPRAQWR